MSNENVQAGAPRAPGKAHDPGTPIPTVRLWGLALAAGVVAGFVSWYVGESAHGYFKPALVSVTLMGATSQQPSEATTAAADVRNAGLVFAILGAALGASLGLAGGLARGNFRAAAGASVAGLLLGSMVGFLAGRCVVPAYQWAFDPLSQSLMAPLLSHAAIWAAVGAAGGLAFGAGLGGRSAVARGLAGGLVGGLLGAVVYELAAAAVFPLDRTAQPISITSSSRMLARFSASLFAAVGAAIATQVSVGDRPSRTTTTQNPDPSHAVS